MFLRSLRIAVPLLLPLLLAEACGTDTVITGPQRQVWYLSAFEGDKQEAAPGETLGQRFVVQARGGAGPVAGVEITWSIESGEGVLESSVTTTDAEGLASTGFTTSTYRSTIRAKTGDPNVFPAFFRTVPRPLAVYARLVGQAICTGCERFVFFPDSSFGLRFSNGYGIDGSFTLQDSLILLNFSVGQQASAALRGDSLLVQYPTLMQLSDYENGTFVLERGVVLSKPASH